MTRSEALEALRRLDAQLAAAPWRPDLDTTHDGGVMWTGKWYTGEKDPSGATAGPVGATCLGDDGGAREATALAELRNLVPELVALLSGGGAQAG